jgi:hypothetical protein
VLVTSNERIPNSPQIPNENKTLHFLAKTARIAGNGRQLCDVIVKGGLEMVQLRCGASQGRTTTASRLRHAAIKVVLPFVAEDYMRPRYQLSEECSE